MSQTPAAEVPPQGGWRARRRRAHRWFRVGLAVWAVGSTTYLFNSMRKQGVEPALLRSSSEMATGTNTSAPLPSSAVTNARELTSPNIWCSSRSWRSSSKPTTQLCQRYVNAS